MIKTRRIVFRVDEHLYNAITLFAKEKNMLISDVCRDILVMHFMSVMLGYTIPKTFEDMQKEVMEKFGKKRKK